MKNKVLIAFILIVVIGFAWSVQYKKWSGNCYDDVCQSNYVLTYPLNKMQITCSLVAGQFVKNVYWGKPALGSHCNVVDQNICKKYKGHITNERGIK